MLAAAQAASQPAWPPPITNTRSVVRRPHHGYYVEAYLLLQPLEFHVVIHCCPQVAQFLIVNGILGFCEQPVAPGLHLDEHHRFSIQGYDINVTVPRVPVALQDGIALPLQVVGCQLLAP